MLHKAVAYHIMLHGSRERRMLHAIDEHIEPFLTGLSQTYQGMYGRQQSEYPHLLLSAGRTVLRYLARSDAPYHNLSHTILVTSAGQDILRGKQALEASVTPRDWLHVTLALLCHDIGYVRGLCQNDQVGVYATGSGQQTVTLRGGTDAALTPYHVDRGKRFVQEYFGRHQCLDAEQLATYIEHTRFPVPQDPAHQDTAHYPGLVRAADLIGQLGDPRYPQKLPALFQEFVEIGVHVRLGYRTPDDMRAAYPTFFRQVVSPYIQEGLRYLRVTQSGQQWMRQLYGHVTRMEQQQADSNAKNSPYPSVQRHVSTRVGHG